MSSELIGEKERPENFVIQNTKSLCIVQTIDSIKNQIEQKLDKPKKVDTSALLYEWVDTEYIDPHTQEYTTGGRVLLSYLYSTGSPWKKLQKHAEGLKNTEMNKFARTLMSHKGNFYYFMKKSGHMQGSFPEFCFWLGVIDKTEREKIDDNGFLNTYGLESWCHDGYLEPNGYYKIYGKNLLRDFYISGVFWKKLEEYQESMKDLSYVIGGHFPGASVSFGSRINGNKSTNRHITIEEVFRFFQLSLPGSDLRRTVQSNYLPPKELKKWIHTISFIHNHRDEKIRISGKDIFMRAFLSKSGFWPELQNQIKNLPTKIKSGIQGNIPCTDMYYRNHMIEDGFMEIHPRNILLWLGIINTQESILVDKNGFLNILGLRKWCHEGYICPKTGERIYGKDILSQLFHTGHFRKRFTKYVDTLNLADIQAIGGKIPKHERSLSARITGVIGEYTTIETLFHELGIETPRDFSTSKA